MRIESSRKALALLVLEAVDGYREAGVGASAGVGEGANVLPNGNCEPAIARTAIPMATATHLRWVLVIFSNIAVLRFLSNVLIHSLPSKEAA